MQRFATKARNTASRTPVRAVTFEAYQAAMARRAELERGAAARSIDATIEALLADLFGFFRSLDRAVDRVLARFFAGR